MLSLRRPAPTVVSAFPVCISRASLKPETKRWSACSRWSPQEKPNALGTTERAVVEPFVGVVFAGQYDAYVEMCWVPGVHVV